MKTTALALLTAATAATLSTGCLSVTGFDQPVPPRPAEDTLGIRVSAASAEGTAGALVRDVASAASRNLSSRGFRLVDSDAPDVEIAFDVAQTEFNRAGDFIVYDGRVDARISMPSDQTRVVDSATFSARGERALGETAATSRLSAALVPQIDAWLTKAVTTENLGVDVLSFTVEYRHVSASRKAALVNDFIQAVLDTDGVRDCRLVSEAWLPRGSRSGDCTAVYRVIYDMSAFPNGPLNTISLAHPDLHLVVLPSAR